jgi:hypothetical protein
MQNYELVRAAADVIREHGWTSGTDAQGGAINARDERGEPVPLLLVPTEGTGRASINPAAAKFSIYGALVRASATAGQSPSILVWETLQDMAAAATDVAHGGTNHVHPILQYNEMEGRNQQEVLDFLELVAVALGAPARLKAGTSVTAPSQFIGEYEPIGKPVVIGVTGQMGFPKQDAAREKAIMDRIVDDPVQPLGPDDPRLPPMPYPGSE